MINTSISLSDASTAYLEKLLEGVPSNLRTVVWHQINTDVKKAKAIWKQIDAKNKLTNLKDKPKTPVALKAGNKTIVNK